MNNILTLKTQSIDLGGTELESERSCKFCGGRTVKNGTRINKRTVKHRFLCQDCGRTFTEDAEYGKLSVEPRVVALILDLYFKGVSLRKIVDHLEQFYGIKTSHVAVYKWIQKYMTLINKHVSKFKPEVGSMWHGDEMMMKVDGDWLYMWNMLDKETRFLITSQLTKGRETKDAINFFKQSMKTGGKPELIITDGLGSYRKAYKKIAGKHWTRNPEFHHRGITKRVQHVPYAGFMKKVNNNPVERLHGTVRERDKVMRGLKRKKTADTFVESYKTYYNYVREHSKLGTTPAEKAGIDLELGQERWIGLLKKSVSAK